MSGNILGDGPVTEKYREQMTAIMATLDEFMNTPGEKRSVGIVVLTFPFGETPEGRCNFMSNGADRKDLVVLFKEMIARFEGQPEMKGRA
ncbi:MAG: hypothetical protein Q8K13_10440 [Parvibaculum sp.]|uniref:hypothetical protein n=1 Tax=Parvibaculum sp. TaxID=2024848 RepID=UPI00272F6B7B|nr:hypothetical protein [Parvibaculum sp.]MDP2150046.1 hypothetical protein [Parvibaculum sp.]